MQILYASMEGSVLVWLMDSDVTVLLALKEPIVKRVRSKGQIGQYVINISCNAKILTTSMYIW